MESDDTGNALLASAQSMFEELLPSLGKGRNVHPTRAGVAPSPDKKKMLTVLEQAGLLDLSEGQRMRLGKTGNLVFIEQTTCEAVLRNWWNQTSGAKDPQIQNTFNGPVGAVAAAPDSVAHGTVNIGAVDQSLHRLIELQNELGEVSDDLWTVLRRVRELELKGKTDLSTLKADVLELEVESFAKKVKPQMHEHITEVLKCVPSVAKSILGAQ